MPTDQWKESTASWQDGATTARSSSGAGRTTSHPKGSNYYLRSRGNKILHNAELKLVEVRIRQCTYTIDMLKAALERKVATTISALKDENENNGITIGAADIREQLDISYRFMFNKTRDQQRDKYDRLATKMINQDNNTGQCIVDKSRWVVNHSKYKLSTAETKVLQRGLNFAISPMKLPVLEILKTTEEACIRIDDPVKKEI